MLADATSIIFGLGLLYFGAEGLVRGSSELGLRFGITPLVVGLTIVAFGTSAPELAVSMNAAHMGKTDVSITNVLGSNIANIGLILAICAIVHPILVEAKLVRHDIPAMIAATLLFCVLIADGIIKRPDAALLTIGIIVYVIFNTLKSRQFEPSHSRNDLIDQPTSQHSIKKELVFIIMGLMMLVIGGKYLVDGAVQIARHIGLSEAVIGLTIVAVGTSMPELATSTLAAAKKMSAIAIGNVVGSNIFNILSVLGLSALVHPLPLGNVTTTDIIVTLLFSLAMLPLACTGKVISKKEGLFLLASYFCYIGWRIYESISSGAGFINSA